MELKLTFFKETGKYYTDEMFNMPDNIEFWDFTDIIRNNYKYIQCRLIGMYCIGEYPNGVPFLCKIV